ncbi:hypothetical protein WDW37_00525 [Bdellovibrionota bacterium FG-1]
MKARQYTIRNVSNAVDRALEKEAGIGAPPPKYHDLDFLIGSWVADPETNRALRAQRKIDKRDWK